MHGEQWKGAIKKEQSLTWNKAEKAVGVLAAGIKEIRNVQDWAEKACMSPDWLRKTLRRTYHKSPKQILREVRFETVVRLIEVQSWEASADGIAIDSGIGDTCKALHKFLKRHYGTTFTELREEVLTGKWNMKFVWLNGVSYE